MVFCGMCAGNCCNYDRQPAAGAGPARPRGHGHDQGPVHAAVGRPRHRQHQHRPRHGGHQQAQGCGQGNPEVSQYHAVRTTIIPGNHCSDGDPHG